MVWTGLIFFGGTGLAGNLNAEILIVFLVLDNAAHALMDCIPVGLWHIDRIADVCRIIDKQVARGIRHLI